MIQSHRLDTGGSIDRGRPITFSFNGASYEGYHGDTLASALLANGVHLVGRSFKYHRPRGIFGAGAEEPNALVRIGRGALAEPNLKATQVALVEGLVASSVNCWPSPRFDLGAIIQLFARIIPAGFYYKTFMWPNWHLFEPAIRRAAGLGVAPSDADPDRYLHAHADCDVLVVGSGPSGIAAALSAARDGKRVIVAEEDVQLGGSTVGTEAGAQVRDDIGVLRGYANIRLFERTTVFGYYDHNSLAALERCDGAKSRQRLWHIRAKTVVLATGAVERPIVFPGNDRPGVMLASAVQTYLERFAVLCGSEIVVFTNNDAAYATAHALKGAGARVTLVDSRQAPPSSLVASIVESEIRIEVGSVIIATRGAKRVRGVVIAGRDGSRTRSISCDTVAMSGGWSPVVHLFSQSGGSLRYDEQRGMFVPDKATQPISAVGGASGESVDMNFEPLWHVAGRGKAFVDFANDVTDDDIALAARENFVSVEHLKRYTTLGMGVDQGKTSNVNGLAIMGAATGREPGAVGTTRFRPPYSPVTMGAVAGPYVGSLFRPVKYLPAHEWHVARSARFEDQGGWLRPTAYPQASETWDEAAHREARAVRRSVGLFDSSSLGKIEVQGPDAAKFLDHIYLGTLSTLEPGRARYGLILNENGTIIDDGVVARQAPDRFLVHTTSGGVDRIAAMMEEWLQCEWVDWDVVVLPVSTNWATFTISGPGARHVLDAVGTDIALGAEAFPHMHYREGLVAGLPARVLRASFTGEASYEINVPSGSGMTLAEALWRAGRAFGLTPYGIEALMMLRTEKGYLHIGVDTDGTTLPADVGLGTAVAKKAANFIGRRSLTRPDSLRPDRLQLVGLRSGNLYLAPGAQIMESQTAPCVAGGYVTSSYVSPALGRPIALALIRRGRSRLGETVRVYDMGAIHEATIVDPVFYDKPGERLNV